MSAEFAARRSTVRQLMLAAAGIVLLVAALDIVSLHKLSDPPTTDDNGNLTSKGQTERRTDIVWGSLFVVAGGVMLVVGLGGLVGGRAVIELTDDAMRLRVAGPMTMLDIPWQDITAVRAGRDYDDGGRVPVPLLLVDVVDPEGFPEELWGAVWEGNTLEVDADGWDVTVDDVVIRSELILDTKQKEAGL
jgi:hypothetical protein